MKIKTAYSYLRWSKSVQGDSDKASRARQNKSATEWIKNHGKGEYKLSDEQFIDAGKSAFKGKHIAKDDFGKAKGELARFIELVEENKIFRDGILLIDSYDRFSRLKPTQSINLFMSLINSGIGIVFTGSYDKRVINSDLIDKEAHILGAIVGEISRTYTESFEKARKIKDGLDFVTEQIKSGIVRIHHHAPHYYTFVKDQKRYEQNELAQVVKNIIKDFIGGESCYAIAKKLNANGIRSIRYAKKQKNWSRMAVQSLLENKCLYGEFYGMPNYFAEPIITKDEWEQIQLQLKRRDYGKGKHSTDFINIFRGLAKCPYCHDAMSIGVQARKGESYRYIRCSRKGNGKPCQNNHQMTLGEIETEFFIEALQQEPEALFNGHDNKDIDKQIVGKEFRIGKINEQINKFLDLVESSPDNVKPRITKLQGEQDTLKTDIANLNMQKVESNPQIFLDFKKMWNVGKTDLDLNYDRAVIKIQDRLMDVELRKQLTTILPSIISKLEIDTNKREWVVFNRASKEIYRSKPSDFVYE